ncbi:DUF3558 domain-containing protein [Demequina maris]|uniref:DUF3558 domain-containing protein n=1 Tax=Demequina maris TaxID=1638982 RepID=UPI00078626AD|nr:DUF3558 domain-containing protein [Demequina maris]
MSARTVAGLAATMLAVALGVGGCWTDREPEPECITPSSTCGPLDAAASASATEPATVDAAAATGLPDPCDLLSAADLEAASGVGFGGGVLAEDIATETQASCVWNAIDGPLPIVQVLVVAGADLAASQRESTEEWMGASADVDVAGATDAYAVGEGTILGMQVDDVFVEVSYMSGDEGDLTAITADIAEVVAGNL